MGEQPVRTELLTPDSGGAGYASVGPCHYCPKIKGFVTTNSLFIGIQAAMRNRSPHRGLINVPRRKIRRGLLTSQAPTQLFPQDLYLGSLKCIIHHQTSASLVIEARGLTTSLDKSGCSRLKKKSINRPRFPPPWPILFSFLYLHLALKDNVQRYILIHYPC